MLLTDATTEAGAESAELRERGVIVVPPGVSSVTANGNTVIVRLFDHRTTDLLEKATNSESYAVPHPNVAPLVPWPAPNDGDRLRVYNVDQIPAEPDALGVSSAPPPSWSTSSTCRRGPRDPDKLSPHHHDDFEQCWLPWRGHTSTTSAPRGRPSEASDATTSTSWSAALGGDHPPPTVHTSEAIAPGRNQLTDIFCPPREDFSMKEGWVLNAAECPMP